MNKNGLLKPFTRNLFSTRIGRIKKPADIIIKEKIEPKNAPNVSTKLEIIEAFYSEFIKQPRSKLKLPIDELIKPRIDTRNTKTLTSSTALKVQSKADKLLERLRSDNSDIIPRLETINQVSKELALEGSWEKAESLILNMKSDFGVEPSSETLSYLALAYLNGGRRGTSIKCLAKIPEWGEVAQTIYKSFISECLKRGESEKAENLYNLVRSRCFPSPELTGLILMNYGKTGRIEMGLNLYKEIVASGMEPNPVTHSAMIYLCTRSKRNFESAINFYDQMNLLNFPIHLRVHNYMMQGCSKSADLDRAMSIWNGLIDKSLTDPKMKPNEFSLSSILWALASVETSELKLSKREFHYETESKDLINLATEIYRQGTSIIKLKNSHLSNGYLAVLTDNLAIEKAEDFFNNEMIGDCNRTQHSYELMFKMYDNLRDFDKTLKLKTKMDSEKLIVPFEGWRAMVRTAALNNDIETAMKWLKEMNENGYKPSIEDMKVLKLRICELKKFNDKPKFEALCLPEPKPIKKVVSAWRDRSKKLDEFFKSVYGKDAPKLATKID